MYYNNSLILCVCLSVTQSHLRSREWEVVSPCSLLRLEEPIRRAVPEKKPLQVFCQLRPQSRARTATRPVTLSGIKPANNFNYVTISFSIILQRNEMVRAGYHGQDQGHALYIVGTVVAIALDVNGL